MVRFTDLFNYFFFEIWTHKIRPMLLRRKFALLSWYNFLILGTVHGEELRSLFYQEIFFPPTLKGVDRIVSEQVVELFVNFITYG